MNGPELTNLERAHYLQDLDSDQIQLDDDSISFLENAECRLAAGNELTGPMLKWLDSLWRQL